MATHYKGILTALIGIIIIAGVFFFVQQQKNKPTEEGLTPLERITQLSIEREDLDPQTLEDFQANFTTTTAQLLADPDAADAFKYINILGTLKQAVGDYEGALEAYFYARELNPADYAIVGNIANVYRQGLGDYRKAEEHYLAVLDFEDLRPGNHYTYFAELYELYAFQISNQAKAEALIARALSELPENLRIMSLAAEHYKRAGDTAKARELYEIMLTIDPGSTVARDGLESLLE